MPQICKRCLYTDSHPLGIVFDEEGICSGCRIHEEKDHLDWDHRWELLQNLVEPYRQIGNGQYDCIVPVSGASDSYYIVDIVKNKLKLNPLLVHYNRYYNTPLGIRNLSNLRIKFDCDLLSQNVNPVSVRSITRSSLNHLGSVYWHVLAGHTVFPVQTAVNLGIPLIIWGAHQGLEQVGMFSHTHQVEMSRRYRKDHDLMNKEAMELINLFDTLSIKQLHQYLYPDDARIHENGVRGIYLGNFVRWDPKAQHEQMVNDFDYKGAHFPRTFDTYDHVDCYVYMGLHDLLKLYRHGYSKVTDHACREIRHGRLTRAEAVSLVRKHRFAQPKHVDLFRNWLGITEQGLGYLLDQHRNPQHWYQEGNREWVFVNDPLAREPVSHQGTKTDIGFQVHEPLKYNEKEHSYVVVGKGYP